MLGKMESNALNCLFKSFFMGFVKNTKYIEHHQPYSFKIIIFLSVQNL